ncbi:MAG: phytase [bacterium]
MLPFLLALAPAIVTATVETDPVPDRGDAADDMCIWIDARDPSRSTIIGTNKRGGLAVYDLAGRQIQYLKGETNNVDVRYGFPLGGRSVDIVAATTHHGRTIEVFAVDRETRTLAHAGEIVAGIDLYGTCMYHDQESARYYVFVTSKDGAFEQWELEALDGGKVGGKRVRALSFGGQAEGCVADDALGVVYVSEESKGIWRVPGSPGSSEKPTLVDRAGDGHLVPDVEGLALYCNADGTGFLIASSQGNDTFAVYRREGRNDYVTSFAIGAGTIDGAEETDGIDVSGVNLGPSFERGLFVAQNGRNDRGNQSFLLVPWDAIAAKLGPLQVAGRD